MNKEFTNNSSRPHGRAAHVHARPLFVLIACEESQAETAAFRRLGHIAFSCDIQQCRQSGNPEWHIKGDVTPYLQGKKDFILQTGDYCTVPGWDLIIAHPPCTYLCKAGSLHLYKNPNYYLNFKGKLFYINLSRYQKLLEGRKFFMECLKSNAHYVAVENPIPMSLANLPPASTFSCPSWYGVKYTKKTLYWLKNLPPLMAEFINSNPRCYVSSSRGKYRSRTFPQMADAIARQWSEYILTEIENGKYS